MRPKVIVDVVSDVACPWCFLGKRRLERAIALVPGADIAVHWRPYRLDPTIPPEGMDRTEYIVRKFGSLEALDAPHARLEQFGRDEGVTYRFDLIKRAADTTNAHRLIRWAGRDGKQDSVVERLFAANFSEGRDIGDIGVLAEIASETGMDPKAVAHDLRSDRDRAVVLAEIDEAGRIGITGVPTFIVDQRYGVVGAHPAEALAGAIRKALEEAGSREPADS